MRLCNSSTTVTTVTTTTLNTLSTHSPFSRLNYTHSTDAIKDRHVMPR